VLWIQGYCGELRNYCVTRTHYHVAAKRATFIRSRSFSTRSTRDVDRGATHHWRLKVLSTCVLCRELIINLSCYLSACVCILAMCFMGIVRNKNLLSKPLVSRRVLVHGVFCCTLNGRWQNRRVKTKLQLFDLMWICRKTGCTTNPQQTNNWEFERRRGSDGIQLAR